MPGPLPSPPPIGPARPGPPPSLPSAFSATVLLTPFDASQIAVARIGYDSSSARMLIELWGLAGGYAQYLNVGSDTWLRTDPGGQWQGPFEIGWVTPKPTLLSDMGAQSIGTASILQVDCSWWASASPCTNGCEQEGPDCPKTVGSWTWLRTDTGAPWRMFFVDKGNPYKLPAIGDYAMVNWATFTAAPQPGLAEAEETCRATARPPAGDLDPAPAALLARQATEPEGATTRADPLGSIIPGLHLPSGPVDLPVWPDTLMLWASTIPTAELTVNPTIVCYDWPISRMLTRLYGNPNGGYDDLILTDSTTYDVSYASDGSHRCNGTEPVGLPRPNWPESDNGEVKAVIDGGTSLSPYGTTQLIALPSDQGRTFWIWYTTPENRAVLFTEVPQLCDVGLVLIDYWGYEPNETFDPSLFDIPGDCLGAAPPAPPAQRAARPRARRQAAANLGSGRGVDRG
jgi:hypothetical protein